MMNPMRWRGRSRTPTYRPIAKAIGRTPTRKRRGPWSRDSLSGPASGSPRCSTRRFADGYFIGSMEMLLKGLWRQVRLLTDVWTPDGL